MKFSRARTLIPLLAIAAVLALPAGAAAQDCDAANTDPTAAQYCPPVPPDGDGGGGGSSGGSAVDAGGTLPFTGLDLGALFAVALALTGAGLALRRLSARETGT